MWYVCPLCSFCLSYTKYFFICFLILILLISSHYRTVLSDTISICFLPFFSHLSIHFVPSPLFPFRICFVFFLSFFFLPHTLTPLGCLRTFMHMLSSFLPVSLSSILPYFSCFSILFLLYYFTCTHSHGSHLSLSCFFFTPTGQFTVSIS